MGKFIDRQKLEAHFSPAITGKEAYTAGEVLLSIQKFPSADVVPVIHAHWEYRYDTGIYQTEFLCSRCKGLIETYSCTVDEVEYEHCPNCGAKMDEEVEDA